MFGVADYVVFGGIIGVSLFVGILFAIRDKRHNTSTNYFLGNKKQKALPLGISFVVTFMSSIMFLGTPAEVYLYGIQYVIQLVGVYLGFILAAAIVVPLYHPLGVTSCYEYYYLRYESYGVRYLGVSLGALYYIMYIGVVLNGASLALRSTTGLETWITIVVFSTSAITYTSIGGIKAVIWTDVFQSIIIFAGIVTVNKILEVLIKILTSFDDVQVLIEIGKERLQLFDFNVDPTVRHTFWTLVLGIIPQMFYSAVTQAGVQRIMSTPDISTGKRILYYAAPIYCAVWGLCMFQGVCIFAYFKAKRCDPVASGQVENPNQIVPFVMLELFHSYPGVPGLFIAALAAASLSTISSGLSGLAAVASMDVLLVVRPNIKDVTVTNMSKVFVIIFGLISAAIAFTLSNVEGPLGQILSGFAGAFSGPETGMFLVSVFFRRCRPKALILAAMLSLSISLWIIIGQTFSSEIKQTPYLPPGPTDNCSWPDASISSTNAYIVVNTTHTTQIATTVRTLPSTTLSLPNNGQESRSMLDTMYSISYMYIHLLGTLLTIILAVLGSVITQPSEPEIVNEKCVLPLTILIPSILKRCTCMPKKKHEPNETPQCDYEETDSML